MLYFDEQAELFALNSQELGKYELDEASLGIPDGKLLTDGTSYFLVPPEVWKSPNHHSLQAKDIESLQDYFFSDEAVAAALEVTDVVLKSVDKGSLTYGTTGAQAIHDALVRIAAGPKDKFLDIGCGCGLPVHVAAGLVKLARGVEIVPPMVDFARRSSVELGFSNTEFEAANIRDLDIDDVDIVYLAGTTMTLELRTIISQKLEQLRPGALVISLTYAARSEHLVLVDKFRLPFSWWNSKAISEHEFLVSMRRAQ